MLAQQVFAFFVRCVKEIARARRHPRLIVQLKPCRGDLLLAPDGAFA
jgi:hypothetical protein